LTNPGEDAHRHPVGAAAQMASALHILVLVAFAALMAVAAFEDFRRFTIPNWLTLSLCALWPLFAIAELSLGGALSALGLALLVFLVGALLFSRGYVGGGDVKLLAGVILWAGPALAAGVLIVTGLIGGALALLLVSPFGAFLIEWLRGRLKSAPAPA